MFVFKKLEKFDQTSRAFLKKLKKTNFSYEVYYGLLTSTSSGTLILKYPQTKPFGSSLLRLRLFKFTDKLVPAVGIQNYQTQTEFVFLQNQHHFDDLF